MPLEVGFDPIHKKRVSIVSEHGRIVVIEENLEKKLDKNGPDDKYYFFVITCIFLGLMCSIPTSFIMTANQYWMDKFRNTSTNVSDGSERTVLQANFSSACQMVQAVISVISMVISSFAGHKVTTKTRVFIFFPSFILLFVAHIGFIDLDTDSWQFGFFILVMVTMVIQTAVSSLCGIAIMALVSKFPHICLHWFLLGQGAGDILTPLLSLLSVSVISSFKDAAYMYFVLGTLFVVAAAILFTTATKTEYFKYYYAFSNEDVKRAVHNPSKLWAVFKEIWILPVMGSLSMFTPVHTAITSLVVSEYKGTGSAWGDTYFVPVVTYVLGAVASTFGRAFCSKAKWGDTVWFVLTVMVLNGVVVPVPLYFCNAQPRHNLPVVFKKDWEYAVFYLIYRFFSGILMSSIMLLVVKLVKKKEDYEIAFALNVFVASITSTISSFIAVAEVNML